MCRHEGTDSGGYKNGGSIKVDEVTKELTKVLDTGVNTNTDTLRRSVIEYVINEITVKFPNSVVINDEEVDIKTSFGRYRVKISFDSGSSKSIIVLTIETNNERIFNQIEKIEREFKMYSINRRNEANGFFAWLWSVFSSIIAICVFLFGLGITIFVFYKFSFLWGLLSGFITLMITGAIAGDSPENAAEKDIENYASQRINDRNSLEESLDECIEGIDSIVDSCVMILDKVEVKFT